MKLFVSDQLHEACRRAAEAERMMLAEWMKLRLEDAATQALWEPRTVVSAGSRG